MRVSLYILGFFAISFGVVFCLRSGIGLSTWDTLHYALHKLTNITIGTATIIVAGIFTVAVVIMNKKLKSQGLVSTSRTGAIAMTRGALVI